MLLCPVASSGAGLGRLAVHSALGQPFKAEIDLVAVKKQEKPFLTVRLAPQEIFRQASVDYVPLLSTFKASIENHPDGQPYVKIISSQPIAEPLLNMLVELNWSSGRLLREYTVVLTPPEMDANPPITAVTQPPLPPGSIKVESVADEKQGLKINSPVSGEKTAVLEPHSITKAHTVYGPVKRGDTLGGIVRNIIPPAGVSFNQMLVALHRANRDAFFGNNIHRLKTGPILRVPNGNEIASVTPAEADKEVEMQTVDWARHRLPDRAGSTPENEELKQRVTGTIEPTASVDVAGAREPPDGFLKLSQGKELPTADDAGGENIGGRTLTVKDGSGREAGGTQEHMRAVEEDAIAKRRSLGEANERISLLEKNIKELQRLL
ncbi:MAG: FimV/HubP family polar landmark protein, partial [Nitrosospira sp.]